MQTTLRVLAPPATEPVDLDTLRAHARIDFDADETLQLASITAARSWVESYLARVLVQQTLRMTMVVKPLLGLPGQVVPLLSFPAGQGSFFQGHKPVELSRCPVQKITAVGMVDQFGVAGTVDPSQFVADLDSEPATIRFVPGFLPPYLERMSIDFVAGYDPDTNPIPQPILHAIQLLATYLYEHRGDEDAEPPRAVRMLLDPYRILYFGG